MMIISHCSSLIISSIGNHPPATIVSLFLQRNNKTPLEHDNFSGPAKSRYTRAPLVRVQSRISPHFSIDEEQRPAMHTLRAHATAQLWSIAHNNTGSYRYNAPRCAHLPYSVQYRASITLRQGAEQ